MQERGQNTSNEPEFLRAKAHCSFIDRSCYEGEGMVREVAHPRHPKPLTQIPNLEQAGVRR